MCSIPVHKGLYRRCVSSHTLTRALTNISVNKTSNDEGRSSITIRTNPKVTASWSGNSKSMNGNFKCEVEKGKVRGPTKVQHVPK